MIKNEDLIWLIFEHWKRLNFSVNKGEKSLRRDYKGRAMFSERQVHFIEYSDLPEGCDYDVPNM